MNVSRIDCEEVLRHLLEYLDRDLDEATMAAIGHHLELCHGCFSRAEFERRIKDWLCDTGSRRASQRLRLRLKSILGRY